MSRQTWDMEDREQNNKGTRITGVREEGQEISVGRRGNNGEQNRGRNFVVD